MPTIDIDFDVFKQLTIRRDTEKTTYNDVVRELLGLAAAPSPTAKHHVKSWTVSDTSFPERSDFVAEYKGKTYKAAVKNGKLELADGHRFSTPSAAAVYITGTHVNGWRFWKCKLPESSEFLLLERLRGKSHV